nr:immunoglobulin heavy chain junction region [Macaca mulatta]MOX67345.1 immunoglobulin heavy chain junction region [Macaca mulatta]MOX68852.1 immunoglobulin heavy chain junction region [Macaca mulatta]
CARALVAVVSTRTKYYYGLDSW